MLSEKEKKTLLSIARRAIEIHPKKLGEKDFGELTPALREKRGAFVTLTLKGNLRGCIGYIEPVKELCLAVAENAVNAAYSDPRFPPLSEEEKGLVKIEVSVLSQPEGLYYKDAEELLKILEKKKPGVIVREGLRSATFLPQVWESVPAPEEFLSELCLKAGLPANEWRTGNLEVQTYTAEHFQE